MEGIGMKTGRAIIATIILLCASIMVAEEYSPEQKQALGQKAVHEMMKNIEVFFSKTTTSINHHL